MLAPSPTDFTRGVPDPETFPVEELAASEAALQGAGASALQYGPAEGFAPLREWLADWLHIAPGQVLTSNGSLQLIDLLCTHLLRPGDVVCTESPTYDRTLKVLGRHGVRVVGVPVRPDGPAVADMQATILRTRPKLFYVIPDFQNPTGATWPGEKRRWLVDFAARQDLLVLEDSPYRLLRYRGREEPTLFSLAPDRVLHLGSLTKLLAPGLRIGYAVGAADLVSGMARIAADTYISPGYVAQAIANEWCRRGLLPARIARLKAVYGPRLDACLAALERHLPGAEHTRPDGGFFVSVTLPEGVAADAVRLAAASQNLRLSDGASFYPDGGGARFLRIPFCAMTEADLETGVRRLADVVRQIQG